MTRGEAVLAMGIAFVVGVLVHVVLRAADIPWQAAYGAAFTIYVYHRLTEPQR